MNLFINFLDFALLPIFLLAFFPLFLFTKVGPSRLFRSRNLFKSLGIFPIKDHYYHPLFNDKLLRIPLSKERFLPGIDLNVNLQISLLEKLNFSHELVDLNLSSSSNLPSIYNLQNGSFESGDAEMLYNFVRFFQPKKVVEIGSGHSTKIASMALQKNYSINSIPFRHICIEPYEMAWLKSLPVELRRDLVENVEMSLFESLEKNDILFIDSSHIIRPQGDVLCEYLQIIPSLNSGVIVHVHDIFTPRDYLEDWVKNKVLFWNEQYLLEALLANSSRYEILSALNYLKNNHFKLLKTVCPYLTIDRQPGSFYFRVRDL